MTHTNHLSPDLCGPKKPSTSNLTVARQIPLHHTRQNGEREGRDRRSVCATAVRFAFAIIVLVSCVWSAHVRHVASNPHAIEQGFRKLA